MIEVIIIDGQISIHNTQLELYILCIRRIGFAILNFVFNFIFILNDSSHKPFKITKQDMSQFSKKSDLKGLTQYYISINFTLMHKIQVVICGKSLTLQSWDYEKKTAVHLLSYSRNEFLSVILSKGVRPDRRFEKKADGDAGVRAKGRTSRKFAPGITNWQLHRLIV